MEMKNISGDKDLPIGKKLLSAEVILANGRLNRVTLIFEDDQRVECAVINYNELGILVTAPPKMVDKWRVWGKIRGDLPLYVNEYFDSESDANDYIDGLYGTFGTTGLTVKTAQARELGVKTACVKVCVKVFDKLDGPEVNDDQIPF